MAVKLLALLLGAWIGGALLLWLVATANFRTVDRVLQDPTPQAAPVLASLPEAARRPLLRHLVSELNRLFFRVWGTAQLVLAVAVLVLLLGRVPRNTTDLALAGVLLALAAVLLLGINPPMVHLGRAMDFLPRHTPPPQMAAFGRLHALYSVLDLAKLVLAGILTWRVLR